MPDVGCRLDIELNQQIELARRRIDFGSDFGIRQLARDFIGLAELPFDLDEKRDHARLQTTP
jgi:hypothetical protein